MSQEISQVDLDQAIKEGLVILDVYGPHCGPCRSLDVTLQLLERDYPALTILKMNIAENEQFASENHIVGVPTLFFYHDGQLIERKAGALDEEAIMAIAGDYLYE